MSSNYDLKPDYTGTKEGAEDLVSKLKDYYASQGGFQPTFTIVPRIFRDLESEATRHHYDIRSDIVFVVPV